MTAPTVPAPVRRLIDGPATALWLFRTSARARNAAGAAALLVAVPVLAILIGQALAGAWMTDLGPLVWDAFHGDRDAFLTLGYLAILLPILAYAVVWMTRIGLRATARDDLLRASATREIHHGATDSKKDI